MKTVGTNVHIEKKESMGTSAWLVTEACGVGGSGKVGKSFLELVGSCILNCPMDK